MIADKHTHTHTDRQTRSSQYSAPLSRAERIRTSVVVTANEADARVTLGQTHEALVATVESTAREASSTVGRLAPAAAVPGLLRRPVAVASFLFRTWIVLLFHLGVVRVVVAVVAQSRRLLLRLAGFPLRR